MAAISLLQLLRVGVVVYEWMDIPFLKRYYGFGFDHYEMSWKKIGLIGLVKSLLFETGPFASRDWICSDLSIQSAVELNKHLQTFPNTYYFRQVTVALYLLDLSYACLIFHETVPILMNCVI